MKNDAIRAYRLSDYKWDDEALLYRYPNGRKVPQRDIFLAIQRENNQFTQDLVSSFIRMRSGDITLDQWQKGTEKRIKEQHLKMAAFSNGGTSLPSTKAEVNLYVKSVEYKHLSKFVNQIKADDVSDLQIKARLSLYAHHSKVAYEIGNKNLSQYSKKHIYGRRRLGSCLNHCDDCISYSLLGWQRIEDVIVPGDRCKCGSHCCCSIETSREIKKDA